MHCRYGLPLMMLLVVVEWPIARPSRCTPYYDCVRRETAAGATLRSGSGAIYRCPGDDGYPWRCLGGALGNSCIISPSQIAALVALSIHPRCSRYAFCKYAVDMSAERLACLTGQVTTCGGQMTHLLRCAGVLEGYSDTESLVDILNKEFDAAKCEGSHSGAKPSTGQAVEGGTTTANTSRTRHLVRINSLTPVAYLCDKQTVRILL